MATTRKLKAKAKPKVAVARKGARPAAKVAVPKLPRPKSPAAAKAASLKVRAAAKAADAPKATGSRKTTHDDSASGSHNRSTLGASDTRILSRSLRLMIWRSSPDASMDALMIA